MLKIVTVYRVAFNYDRLFVNKERSLCIFWLENVIEGIYSPNLFFNSKIDKKCDLNSKECRNRQKIKKSSADFSQNIEFVTAQLK
jgi:hypothetical protein